MDLAAVALASTVLLGFCRAAPAQDINIDFGVAPTPSPQYGAASGQVGYWNLNYPSFDLAGQPTSASLNTIEGCDHGDCSWCNSGVCPGFSGSADDAALLGTWQNSDCGPAGPMFTLDGLLPGRYVVHVYTYGCANPPTAFVGTVIGGTQFSFSTPGAIWQGTWSGFPVGRHVFDVEAGQGVQFQTIAPLSGGLAALQFDRLDATGQPSCFGDGTGAACPCGNNGILGHGCSNSVQQRGAELEAVGSASLSFDTLGLRATFVKPGATSIVLQGNQVVAPIAFGDGLRCAGGSLKRLFTTNASASGFLSAPFNGGASVSARSAALGDPLQLGSQRIYQVYYRDANPSFCPPPQGSTFNISNAVEITWQG